MKSTLKDVSIVVVTYQGDEITKNCLDSLAAACGDDPQVVVVDNSPSEATRHMVAAYPNTVYVSSPGNPGFAGGNNRALPHCDRPYVLLLNNDTIVHTRESIERMVEFLDENPKCGVVQGCGRLPNSDNALSGCGSYLMPIGFLWATGLYEKESPEFDVPHPCFMVGGFFLMFRRRDLKRFGGFLFRSDFWCYYEESDFCHRVWLSGMEVWYIPTPPIDHIMGATAGKFAWNGVMERYLRNVLFSLEANLSFWSRVRMLPLTRTLIAGHALMCLLRGRWPFFKAEASALFMSRHDKKRLAAARRQIRRLRKVSDREIFKAVVRMPPLSRLLAHFKSRV